MPTIDEIRAKIRRNFPEERSPLRWRKVSENRIASICGRFLVERHGEDDAARYTAILKPHAIIGYRILTAEQAKQICCRHASPLALEESTSIKE